MKNYNNIFIQNLNLDKNSFINWRISPTENIQNLFVMAEGFYNSALLQTDSCLESNIGKRADILIFPIISNLNHGIELYLKSILWSINEKHETGYGLEKGHDIKQLFETIHSRLIKYGTDEDVKYFESVTVSLIGYIKEIYEKCNATTGIFTGDFSRYPIQNKGTNQFYVEAQPNIVVDLERLRSLIINTKNELRMLSEYYYYVVCKELIF